MNRRVLSIMAVLLLSLLPLSAQDFGFGFDDEDTDAGGTGGSFGGSFGAPAVSIGGEASASMTGFVDDFADGPDDVRLGDVFSGKLEFSAGTDFAEGVVNLKLAPAPVYVNEAYVRAYFGNFDIEGGLRKLTWGKADTLGPLDVINPLDYSDLSLMSDFDMMNLKIARPLVHGTVLLGQFSKLEGVFVPNFEPTRLAESGRWQPEQMAELAQKVKDGQVTIKTPDTTTLDYAQAGLRFTTTIGGAVDIGAQYYYGRLATPAVTTRVVSVEPPSALITFAYNPYHQIGLDYAQVIAGFNLRAEFAANITEDISGDDGAVQNPSLAWSLGFDRSLFAGITLTLQCNETIRLLADKVSDNPLLDIEADSDITETRITAQLSKKFLQDELELKAVAIWEAENSACLLMPALIWTQNDVALSLSAGIFAGSEEGLFGQFHDNSFVKAGVKYTF